MSLDMFYRLLGSLFADNSAVVFSHIFSHCVACFIGLGATVGKVHGEVSSLVLSCQKGRASGAQHLAVESMGDIEQGV